jgi:hypothetical protein
MGSPDTIALGRDPWRFACPRGHSSLSHRPPDTTDSTGGAERTYGDGTGEYLCLACRQQSRGDGDPYYDASDIIDKKERERTDDGGWCGP